MTTVNSFPLETVAASTILPPVQWTYSSTTTDADPGDGKFRLNNATPASATAAYIDNQEIGGTDVSDWLDTFDDSGNSTKRGTLTVYSSSEPTIFHIYSVSGSVTDGTGYRKLTIAHVTGTGTFTDATAATIVFTPHSVASDTADTLENKTLTAPDINGGTADALTSLGIRSTGAAFDLKVASTETLTANRTLTLDLDDADRTIRVAGNVTLTGAFSTVGDDSVTFRTPDGAVDVNLPITGTLANEAYVDSASTTGNAATATALETSRNIDGQPFDGTANITVIAPGTHAATIKTTPVDADELPLVDSAASNVLKKLTWANLKTALFGSPVTITGGSSADSSLTLESTSGAGTSDKIVLKTGSQATRLTVDTDGNIAAGPFAPRAKFDLNFGTTNPTINSSGIAAAALYITQADGGGADIALQSFGNDSSWVSFVARGTAAAPEGLTANQVLGGFTYRGYDGIAYSSGSRAKMQVNAGPNDWSTTNHGMMINFHTTEDGTTTNVARWRIEHDGDWLPEADDTYDIGSETKLVADVHATRLIQSRGFPSGRYYSGDWLTAGAGSTIALAADTLYATPMFVTTRQTWTTVALDVTVGAAGDARLGLYNSDPSTGLPSSLVTDFGTVDTTASGLKTIVISQALEPGLYWMAVVSNATPTVRGSASSTPIARIGTTTPGSSDGRASRSFTYAALPASWGTPTFADAIMPMLFFKY